MRQSDEVRVSVVQSARGRLSLAERVELIGTAADVAAAAIVEHPRDALDSLAPGSLPYLLDVNRVTVLVALALIRERRPFVLDTGDDPATLARVAKGPLVAAVHATAERAVLRRAAAVVCRGSFHLPVLRAKTRAPLHWAPDTVPDALLDAPFVRGSDGVVATFGSASRPRGGDRAYGWEVIDLVHAVDGLRGILVVDGPGIEALRGRARRFGVAERVEIAGACPLDELPRRLGPAGFLTSVQSDDLAGWVRTTGKLPIALALGKGVLTTRVGEASRVIHEDLLVDPGPDESIVGAMAMAVRAGVPAGWPEQARVVAERFRRTAVAESLGAFLRTVHY